MMRGAKTTIDAKATAITLVVLSVVLWLGFTVYKEVTGQVETVDGPVEFTGPGFQTDPAILLVILGLSIVIFGIGLKYMRMERAGGSE